MNEGTNLTKNKTDKQARKQGSKESITTSTLTSKPTNNLAQPTQMNRTNALNGLTMELTKYIKQRNRKQARKRNKKQTNGHFFRD